MWLPSDVGDIVSGLVTLRQDIFRKAVRRDQNSYVEYPANSEHPTQYFPNWKLKYFLKEYSVNSQGDPEFCSKDYPKANASSFGFLSVGCCCSLNQTLGFELLLDNESPKNLFRLLMCLDIDFSKLRGVISEHACGLDQYILDREPAKFKYLRTLVDGFHFKGHTKTKIGNSKKDGHSGCSNGYNSMEYKPHWKAGYHTQGRSQIKSQFKRLTPSFSQMTYQSYMIMLKTFFALNNLKRRDQ